MGGPAVFPLQIVFCQAARQFPAEAFEEDLLVVAGLRHAPGADVLALLGGEHDIDRAELAQFFQDASRFVAQPRFLAELAQELPQHVGQEADQNVGQHAVFLLMPHRT